MPKVPDLRFTDITYELWALRELLGTIERQIAHLRAQGLEDLRARMRRLSEAGDLVQADFAAQEYDEWAERILPRFFRCPFLVSAWALYEGGVTQIADYLADQQHARLRITDVRRKDFFSRAKLYYRAVLSCPLDSDPERVDRLRNLLTLRHAIAHGNGRKGAVKQNNWTKIEAMASRDIGVNIERDFFLVSDKLVTRLFDAVEGSLNDLIRRSRGV